MSTTSQPSSRSVTAAPPVQLWMRGMFPSGTGGYVRRKITAVLSEVEEPVRGVRIRLSVHRDPAVPFPVVAQGNLDLGGRPVRAQALGATAREATDLLEARLRYQLDNPPARVDSGSPPRSGQGMPPNPRMVFYPRALRARQIVRCKPVRLALLGVDEAVLEMERRDYYFHLFTEIGTRQDSVVYRAGPIGYRFAQVIPAPERLAPHTVHLTWYDRPAPRLKTAAAVERFGMCEVSFLFFLDVDRERGSVLYRRYDGHYGLLRPRGRLVPGGVQEEAN